MNDLTAIMAAIIYGALKQTDDYLRAPDHVTRRAAVDAARKLEDESK